MQPSSIDFAAMQTAAGMPKISEIGTSFNITKKEKCRLRGLGSIVSEISARPEMQEKKELWLKHNDLHPERPMVFADPENGWNEIIPTSELQTEDQLARIWEMNLLKQIYWADKFKDDKVIESYFDVPWVYTDDGWGVELIKHGGDSGGSYIVEPAINDYDSDLPKVHFPKITIDKKKSEQLMDLSMEIFGDILTVRRNTVWWWTMGMTWDYVNLRGLDNLMMDLALSPESVHSVMELLRDGILKRLEWFEEQGLLSLNTEGSYVGSGGFGWTTQLPTASKKIEKVATRAMWGFCESQETVGVSPEMFGEFILPYQIPILEKFGLNCYGCCEPIDKRWDYVKKIPRLRRVSSSPWADKRIMAGQLGNDYIMSVKPSPTPLSIPILDEDSARTELRETLEVTKGCVIEFIMKDNHTLGNNPENIVRWIEIAYEEIDRQMGC